MQPDGSIVFKDSGKVTVRPDDSRLGDSLVCTLRRPEGYSTVPAAGAACLIGWDGYDPSERYAVMASVNGQAAKALQIVASDAAKVSADVVHVAAAKSAYVESPKIMLGSGDKATVLKSATGSALVAFAFALASSTDVVTAAAANGLLLALTGSNLTTIPPPPR